MRRDAGGIYLCANEGICKEGYTRVADTDGHIWFRHYVFAHGAHNEEIMQTLQKM